MLQEGESGVTILASSYTCTNCEIPCNASEDDVIGISSAIISKNNYKDSVTAAGNLLKPTTIHSCSFGSEVKVMDKKNVVVPMPCKSKNNDAYYKLEDPPKFISKLWTALLQGGENDEPIAPHNICTQNSGVISSKTDNNSLNCFVLQFGAIHFDVKYSRNKEKFTSTVLTSSIIFKGAVLLTKEEKQIARKYIYI